MSQVDWIKKKINPFICQCRCFQKLKQNSNCEDHFLLCWLLYSSVVIGSLLLSCLFPNERHKNLLYQIMYLCKNICLLYNACECLILWRFFAHFRKIQLKNLGSLNFFCKFPWSERQQTSCIWLALCTTSVKIKSPY